MNLEARLRSLMKGEYSHLTISFNDTTAPNYMTVEQGVEEWPEMYEWISEEEKQRAVASNSCWEIQWYPNTPVGFYRLSASTLDALLAAIAEPPGELGED